LSARWDASCGVRRCACGHLHRPPHDLPNGITQLHRCTLCMSVHLCSCAVTHARTHACTHARMQHARMHARTHERTHARMHACMRACVHSHVHASTHLQARIHTLAAKHAQHLLMFAWRRGSLRAIETKNSDSPEPGPACEHCAAPPPLALTGVHG